jgi:nitrilase
MRVAFLQSDALPLDSAKINYYLAQAKRENVKLFLLPEYLLNRFFKELEKMPLSFIKKQSNHQIKLLKRLSLAYNMTILAPLVLIKGDKKYKVIVGGGYNSSIEELDLYNRTSIKPLSQRNNIGFRLVNNVD